MISLGSWHLLIDSLRYSFIQSWTFLYASMVIFSFITLAFYLAVFLHNMHGARREKIAEYGSEIGINISKVAFMICEILYLPLLVNVAWPGMCNFWAVSDDIETVNCNVTFGSQKQYQWTTKLMVVVAYIWPLVYNLRLFLYIKKE